jgi:hypothetical protein
MKPAFRIILALSFSLAACGHSGRDLSLDQTTTALACASASDRDCTPVEDSDAGAPRPGLDECYGNGDCEYGEVCERRHGVSLCQPEDEGRYGHDDGYGGSGGSGGDDSHGGYGGDDSSDRPDGGTAACDPAYADDQPKSAAHDDCDDADHHDDDYYYEDRSGSNSGRH